MASGAWSASQPLGQSLVQSLSDVIGKGERLGIVIDFNRLPGRIDDEPAVLTALQVAFDIAKKLRCELAIQISRNFPNQSPAVHACCLCPKYRVSLSRSLNRARSSLDFTAGTETPSASAVSSVESCSTSRSTKTVRKIGSSSAIALLRIEFSSVT